MQLQSVHKRVWCCGCLPVILNIFSLRLQSRSFVEGLRGLEGPRQAGAALGAFTQARRGQPRRVFRRLIRVGGNAARAARCCVVGRFPRFLVVLLARAIAQEVRWHEAVVAALQQRTPTRRARRSEDGIRGSDARFRESDCLELPRAASYHMRLEMSVCSSLSNTLHTE